jgi:pyruvate dehydrogenase E2 component (dihydrolipoamide acetyltransferase)
MATECKIPNLGDNVDSGEVIALMVKEGDVIEKEAPIAELETGKATIEIPAEIAGKIVKMHISVGDSVKTGQLAMTVEAAADAPAEPAKAEPAKAEPVKTEPAKAEPEKTEPVKAEPPPPPAESAVSAPAVAPASSSGRVPVAAAPSVRKFAREIGVTLADVVGSGPNGRIHIEDVKAHAKKMLTESGFRPMTGGSLQMPALPDFGKWGDIEREKMNNVRKMTAQHMSLCWNVIPHVTQQDKADITRLEEARKRFARKAEAAGGKLTVTAILMKVVAAALKRFPQFNASVDMANEEIVYKKYIHIGVAVDTPKGLVVPVVRDVDRKNIVELAAALAEIAAKARDGKIAPADMQGGSFTISNLGGIGGSFFTPVVNHPEVAILGVGRGAREPVWVDGAFEPRLMLPLSLSYDHRLIDGADGARFIRWLVDALEEPLLVALEG